MNLPLPKTYPDTQVVGINVRHPQADDEGQSMVPLFAENIDQ
jgi:hypothetical protein